MQLKLVSHSRLHRPLWIFCFSEMDIFKHGRNVEIPVRAKCKTALRPPSVKVGDDFIAHMMPRNVQYVTIEIRLNILSDTSNSHTAVMHFV